MKARTWFGALVGLAASAAGGYAAGAHAHADASSTREGACDDPACAGEPRSARATDVEEHRPEEARAPARTPPSGSAQGPRAPTEPARPTTSLGAPTGAPAWPALDRAPFCDDVSIRGLVAGADPRASYVLAGAGARRRGDAIGDRVVLHVGVERVWLARRTSATTYAVCQAELGDVPRSAIEDASRPAAPGTRAGRRPAVPIPGALEVRDGHVVADRAAVAWMLENPAEVARGVRAFPENGPDGRMRGLRVEAVDAAGPLARIGLRAGDLVTRVGPYELTSADALLQAYARLPAVDSTSLALLRNGAPLEIDVTVR